MGLMRLPRIVGGLVLCFWVQAWAMDPCQRAEEFASNCLTHAKRLYHADSLEDARFYAENLLKAAQDTLKAASQCECKDAQEYAEETIKYARKAKGAKTLEDVRAEAENAIGSCEDALKASIECGQ